MTSRNRRGRLSFTVFEYTFHVIQSNNIQRTGKRLKVDLTGAYAAFCTNPDKPQSGWLVFGFDATPGIIAHEAAHGIRQMLINAGVRIDDEVFAYHLHHLVSYLHKFLKV